MRFRWLACVVAVIALVLAGCSSGAEKAAVPMRPATSVGPGEGELKLLALEGSVESGESDPRVDWVTPFTNRTGCKVDMRYADTPKDLRQLAEKDDKDYDGVVAPPDIAGQLVAEHKVAPVNTRLVKHYGDLSKPLRDLPVTKSGGRTYGVPYTWTTDALLYNSKQVNPAPSGWSALFDPKKAAKYRGRLMVPDSPLSIGLAALYLQRSRPDLKITDPYQLTRPQFNAAVQVLQQQKPLVGRYWRESPDAIEALSTTGSGSAVLGAGEPYHLDVLSRAGRPIERASIGSADTPGSADTWLIGAGGDHPNCMYQWLSWSVTPDVQSQVSEWTGEAPANPDACDHLGRGICAAYRADDPDYLGKVRFARLPTTSCGGDRGRTNCVGYAAWRYQWKHIAGS